MKIAIVMGTRPEIIKLSPIINKLNKKNSTVIFTGQHYDYDMSLRFIRELGMRNPEYKMKLTKLHNSTTDRATQIGEIIFKLAKMINTIDPDTIMVQGDTNTVLAAAITGIKCGIPISHVESGLRSYDWRMPEEHNRIAVDHIAEFLFAPTTQSRIILENEKVHGKIFVTGNTSIDAIEQNIQNVEKNTSFTIKKDDFVLVTLHRSENVDDPQTLSSVIEGFIKSNMDIIFPAHPRTIKNLIKFGLYNKIKNSQNILFLPAIGYFDMLLLMKKCTFIVTDSGGLQEEATSPKIRKKVLVVRKTTDRPESVRLGLSELIGTKTQDIILAMRRASNNPEINSHASPYGNGRASEQILKTIRKYL